MSAPDLTLAYVCGLFQCHKAICFSVHVQVPQLSQRVMCVGCALIVVPVPQLSQRHMCVGGASVQGVVCTREVTT